MQGDEKYKDKRQEAGSRVGGGVFSAILNLPLHILFAIFVSAFISFIIEALGIWFGWWDQPGVLHSQSMVEQEIIYLNDRLHKSVLEPVSGITVQQSFEYVLGKVVGFFEFLGVAHYGKGDYYGGFGAYVGAAVNMFILTVLRFMVFVFSLVLYLFFGWVGLSVGILERDKRRAGLGRESGTIFQISRSMVPISVVVPMIIYMSYPDSIDPVFIMWPAAAVFGVSVAYMAASFKKYA